MSKYQEFQQKVKAICNASDYYSSDVIAQKYYSLLAEVLDEFKKLEDIVMEEIMQVMYPEDEEEVTDDDENCWVEYLPPTD